MFFNTKNYITQRYFAAYVFIAPFFILFAIFGLFPIIQSFYLSFRENLSVSKSFFVGFDNYINLFKDRYFLIALKNTFIIWIVSHTILIPGAFILAFIINNVITKGQNFFKGAYFAPTVTSSIAVSLVFMTIFGRNYGFLNFLIKSAGGTQIDFIGGSGFFLKPIIITIFSWRWLGYNTLIILAGLQGIDTELYDYAYVEGATKWQTLYSITLPLMKPILFFLLFTSIVAGLQIYEEPLIVAWGDLGGSNSQGLCLAPYLITHGFARWHFGYASAMAYVLVIIVIITSAASRKFFTTEQ